MFTGIIKEIGTVTDSRLADPEVPDGNVRITFHAPQSVVGTSLGDSIAVEGACLTVTDLSTPEHFSVDVMPESLRLTTLGRLGVGTRVNLEPAVSASARLDGHIVQGHVDGVATVRARNDGENWTDLTFDLPGQLARYVAQKGSVTVAGVSLTVTGVSALAGRVSTGAFSSGAVSTDAVNADAGDTGGDNPGSNSADPNNAATESAWFGVSLIPTTLAHTTLGALRVGDRVNIEVDVIAKYVERLLGADRTAAVEDRS